MSRRIEDLEPKTQELCRQLLAEAAAKGIAVVLVQTLRTHEEQELLYQRGRTRPGLKVTNAHAGYSWHEYGRAFDIAFRQGESGITWKGPWETVGRIGKDLGLIWGGDWPMKDKPHFEYQGGHTLRELRALDPFFQSPSGAAPASSPAGTPAVPDSAPQTTEPSPPDGHATTDDTPHTG